VPYTPEPGWYPDPDPAVADQLRWWDGQAWGAQTAPSGGPMPASAGAYRVERRVEPRRRTPVVALVVAGTAVLAVLGVATLVVLDRIGHKAMHPVAFAAPQAPVTTAPPVTAFPTLAVVPGVNTVVSGGSKPLFEVRGTGSRTSAPLDLSTVSLIGGVSNSGWVEVWIVPEGQPVGTTHPYYTNGAGDGGAATTLPHAGRYVVVVKTTDPTAHWTVDIADQATP
jgi:hypothetical protein